MRFMFVLAIAMIMVWFLTYFMYAGVYIFTGETNFNQWGYVIITILIQFKWFGAIFNHYKLTNVK